MDMCHSELCGSVCNECMVNDEVYLYLIILKYADK